MHSKEIEHQANADQRHMSFTWAWKAHITQILKSYDTLILKLSHFFFFAFIDSMFFVIDQQSCL